FLGMLVWAHHMFATPSPTVVLVFFMLSSFLIAVPTGIKIFNWIATLWRGSIEFTTSLLFAAGFIGTFVIGGITGVFLAVFPLEWFTSSPPPVNNFDVIPRIRSVEPMKDIRRAIEGSTEEQAAKVEEAEPVGV